MKTKHQNQPMEELIPTDIRITSEDKPQSLKGRFMVQVLESYCLSLDILFPHLLAM